MKKTSISIFIILICYLGYGQTYPVTQNLGNTATTKVKTNALEGKLIITAFTDTTAANTEGYLKNYDGSLIKTTSPINALWYRVLDSAKWVQILPTGGGSGGTRAWLDGGNYNVFGDGNGNAVFGTLNLNGVKLTTNATTRLILNKAGIQAETANTVPLGVDTVTKDITYSTGGGGGGSSWLLAGNAGTTPPTSFIGTTDAVPLFFRVDNTNAGFIDLLNGSGLGNTVIGSNTLPYSTTGFNNTSLGVNTLHVNTSGYRNTAIGVSSLSANTSGGDNTAVGQPSLAGNTTGIGNTAIGRFSLDRTTTGRYNVAAGFNAGDDNTTGSRNIFIGSYSQAQNTAGTGSRNIVIGDSSFLATSGSNQLVIGNFIYGSGFDGVGTTISNAKIGIGVKAPDSALHVVGGFKYANGSQANGYVLTSDANGGATWAAASGGGITNGTTTMTGFTNGYIPYNNAGTIGQYNISGSGNVAMTTSPTFTTPALGTPASGTVTNLTGTASININGTVGATTPTTGVFTTVGIGTASPTYKLHVNGNSVMAQAASSAGVGDGYIWDETGSNYFEFLKRGSAAIGNMSLPVGSVELVNYTNGSMGFINYGSGYIAFGTNGANERMRIDNSGNVGIDNTSPTSKLHTTSFSTAYVAKTANYTATISDHTIHFTANTSTFTFPTAVGVTGRIYVVRNDSGNTLSLATTSSQTINGAAPGTQATGTVLQYQSTGANWITISQ